MRKVTEQIATAFLNGQNKTVGNTTTDGQRVWLHGNLIAEKIEPGACTPYDIRLTLAGWNTPTTRERLNGIMQVFGINGGYYQRNFDAYLAWEETREAINENDWQYFKY